MGRRPNSVHRRICPNTLCWRRTRCGKFVGPVNYRTVSQVCFIQREVICQVQVRPEPRFWACLILLVTRWALELIPRAGSPRLERSKAAARPLEGLEVAM